MHRHAKTGWRSSTLLKAAAAIGAAGLIATPLLATHSWNGYHWKRTTTQISPPIGDNVNSTWDSYLRTAVADWNRSSRIESALTTGRTTPASCNPVAGRIEVCNYAYGSTGWLGIASIWLAADGHISQGTTKLNDTYFNTSTYNTFSWRSAVTCQEIGHDYGLGHQDENFNDDRTTSCMEYTNWPAGNEHPDQHDYDQLYSIYSHAHSASNLPTTSTATAPSGDSPGNTPEEWGRAVDHDAHGRPHVFMRDLGNGMKKITHVYWVPGVDPRGRDHH
jgi:hypothetical protein